MNSNLVIKIQEILLFLGLNVDKSLIFCSLMVIGFFLIMMFALFVLIKMENAGVFSEEKKKRSRIVEDEENNYPY